MNATADDQFRFINLLALELNQGDISLPSLPDEQALDQVPQ